MSDGIRAFGARKFRDTACRGGIAPSAWLAAALLLAAPTVISAQFPVRSGIAAPLHADVSAPAVLGAAAVVAMPMDRWVRGIVRHRSLLEHGGVRSTMQAASAGGVVGPMLVGAGLAGFGVASGRRDVRDAGLNASAAMVGASAVTGALKMTLGRARPHVSGGANPRDYAWGRGRRSDDYRALPSGHATVAFALASALTQDRTMRRTARPYGAAAWAGATVVGLSRIYLDMHWASDVLLGAAIGSAAGAAVVRADLWR